MNPQNIPAEEVSVIDAVFQQAPIPPPEGLSPIPDEIEIPADKAHRVRPVSAPAPPLRDYLREIQQEYAAQQDEGKL